MKKTTLALFACVAPLFAYAQIDDIYYNSSDAKKEKEAAALQEHRKAVAKKAAQPKEETEITGVSGDTVFYAKTQRDASGNTTSYQEGFYIDANAAASYNQYDASFYTPEDDGDYTYSGRIKKYHNNAIVIDDDSDDLAYFTLGLGLGWTGWSLYRPYNYWGWSWGYYRPWHSWYSWDYYYGWHRPYYYGYYSWYRPYYHYYGWPRPYPYYGYHHRP